MNQCNIDFQVSGIKKGAKISFHSHLKASNLRAQTLLIGETKSNKLQSNQMKCWFWGRGENRSTRRKTSRSRVENQQTQPTYDAGSGIRTQATLVEGERSHHCAIPAPEQSV